MQAQSVKVRKKGKVQRGRPRLSNLTDKEQARLRMERIRKRRRKENLVPVEVWITKDQRDTSLKKCGDLSEAARKAFDLLLIKQADLPTPKKRSRTNPIIGRQPPTN